MVAKEYLDRSRLFRRLKSGPHGQLVELYAARLVKDGLARQGTWRCLSLAGDLLSWIPRSRSKLTDLDERRVERYLRYRAGKHSIQPGDRAALKRLLSVLRDADAIALAAPPPITPQPCKPGSRPAKALGTDRCGAAARAAQSPRAAPDRAPPWDCPRHDLA